MVLNWVPLGALNNISKCHGLLCSAVPWYDGGSAAEIQIQDATSLICTVEVGLDKGPTHPITVACSLRRWPEKVGELLASMFAFGTLNYCNHLRATPPPEEVRWKAYGLLAIRSAGCLLLEMQLNKEGCHVKLLHEGGFFL